MDGLQKFANHTRHRPPRDGDLSVLGRKWMVTHVAPSSPETYAFIANDYDLVRVRTHSPPLASYAESSHPVDVDTFVWVTKNGYPNGRPLTMEEEQQWPALAQFRDTLWPKPVDQEAWQPFERKDHWKERAYFLAAAGACKNRPQFHALVERIYSEDVPVSPLTKDAVSDLYTRILRIVPEPSPYEIGTLIAALDLQHLQDEQGGPTCEAARQDYLAEVAAEPEPAVLVEQQAIIFVNQPADTNTDITEDGPIMLFRHSELIPPTFPTHKVIQQMLLTYLGEPIPSHLLSSVQRRNSRQPAGPVILSNAVWNWLDSIPSEKLIASLDPKCPQLQSYYFGRQEGQAGQPITPQALIKGVLLDERHRNLWPKVEPSIVKTIKEI